MALFPASPANGATATVNGISYTFYSSQNAWVRTGSGSSGDFVVTGNAIISGNISVTGNIIPTANITYDLGSPTSRFKDLYLSGNTIYFGDQTFRPSNVLPFTLTIDPEVLTINVDAPEAGDDIRWLWSWQQSTLPYARSTIVNKEQVSVPLYMDGTYTINNFAANTIHGNMTQVHHGYFKWIDGAGTQNLIDWVGNYTENVTVTNADINNGTPTVVQRYVFTIPSSITLPTLVAPTVSYNVAVANNAFHMSGSAGDGDNITLGPLRRGGTYTFNLHSSLAGHPFYITTDNGTGFVANTYVGEYTTGVTGSRNDGSAGKTTLTFVVPNNAPDTLFYQSAADATMRGSIVIKDLAVETNINGNYVVYFQHTHEGHKTPVELRPIPQMVNQMCLVYDQNQNRFVPQDMATYVDNTPSFKNKIREVAGTATLIAPNGVAVVPTVLVVEDVSYLPLVNNKEGDIAFDSYTDTMYVWQNNAWRSTKPSNIYGSNIIGSVANANSATTSVTVTANNQPNITSVGTLTGLNINGTITAAHITANTGVFTGNANGLSSLQGTNVVGTLNSTTLGNSTLYVGTTAIKLNRSSASQSLTGISSIDGYASTVSTAAQPNITSVGTLTGLTLIGNANLTNTSNVALGTVSNIHISGGSNGQVLTTDGAGNLSWANTSSGITSSQVTQQIKNEVVYYTNMTQIGQLSVANGVARWYAPYDLNVSIIRARLGTAADATVSINIKNTGSTQKTITFAANSNTATISNQAMSMNLGDYLTIDITSVGSSIKGSDLYLQFGYNKV